jgi:DNA-binding CsgD family transcriptional regulator
MVLGLVDEMSCIYDEKHIVRLSQPQVADLCKPLFQQFGLNYFHFFRVYKDGSTFALFSRMDWHDYFWDNGYRPTIPLQQQQQQGIHLDSRHISLWEGVVNDDVLHDAKNLFDLHKPLAINNITADYMDSFAFAGSASNHSLVNNYFSNLDLLVQFTNEFYIKAEGLIAAVSVDKVYLEPNVTPVEINLLSRLSPKLNFLGFNGMVKLTFKEFETLQLFLAGLSAKEISIYLNRSARTIESHLLSIKNKFCCHKKSEIFFIALRNGIKPKLVATSFQ